VLDAIRTRGGTLGGTLWIGISVRAGLFSVPTAIVST
jgi:hypothetical protein